jgi:hypothetical protein
MFEIVHNRTHSASRAVLFAFSVALVFSVAACNKQQSPSGSDEPQTFGSPEEAGKALAEAAKSQSQSELLRIFGSSSADILSTSDAVEDKASLDRFAQAYQVMNRWRKLSDGTELLLVGTGNQTFPIPLMKNGAGRWYFDAAAGKEELLSRRIGQDEISAIIVCGAVADAQAQYFSEKHGAVKQYAQRFISDAGQQNGLYWGSPQDSSHSPLGPLVAFATADGYKVQPNQHQPFYGYYFAMLDKQGTSASGGAKSYVVNGNMTGGFAVIAYPAKYGDSGIMTFITNQDGAVFQKDLGQATDQIASTMTEFNPDKGWNAVD